MPPIRPSPLWYPTRRPRPQPVARRLLHLSVLFFSLFLVVRTVALEPFGVPTGSMAPTLLGVHRSAPCPRCDYPVNVGEPGPEARTVAWDRCRCPNCGLTVDLSNARVLPGDRLLVDKLAFVNRPPRRWEVAVFDCPADLSKPYVKRIVGFPGEFIQISGGDVYADGQLVRKTLAQVRELMVPVFVMSHAPPGGWGQRWLLESYAVLRGDELHRTDAKVNTSTATYRHWNLDADREEPVDGWLGYNGGPAERRGSFGKFNRADAAHDFVVTFDFRTSGASQLTVRLTDGLDTVEAMIDVRMHGVLSTVQLRTVDGEYTLPPTEHQLDCQVTYRVEFAFVDRRASLTINGVEVPHLDLPAERPGSARRQPTARPLAFVFNTMPLVVRNLRLFRDVHYLPFGVAASGVQLGPAEYFALGDNTVNSHDSRTWQIDGKPAPGVPARGLIGKPFLIHQPMRLARLPVGGGLVQTLDWDRLKLLR